MAGEPLRGPALRTALRATLTHAPAGLLCDVDGTLSPIAPRPELARVSPRVRRALRALRERLALVAIISGRRPADARRLVGVPGLVYVGNHGLEAHVGRRRWTHPAAAAARGPLATVLAALGERLPAGQVRIESKAYSAALHYRGASDPAGVRRAILAQLAELPAARALQVTEGRQVVELRPPVEVTKGTAATCLLRRWALRSAVFLGDDRTDIDAMRALRAARTGGVQTLTIAVVSAEMPPGLRAEADGVVEGVPEVEALLGALAE
ncbi:MAG: trehalose-phosphatase [Chloroflexi bacterium]|nr:trehalose-phosphatase [Chloroflexota bacterium]